MFDNIKVPKKLRRFTVGVILFYFIMKIVFLIAWRIDPNNASLEVTVEMYDFGLVILLGLAGKSIDLAEEIKLLSCELQNLRRSTIRQYKNICQQLNDIGESVKDTNRHTKEIKTELQNMQDPESVHQNIYNRDFTLFQELWEYINTTNIHETLDAFWGARQIPYNNYKNIAVDGYADIRNKPENAFVDEELETIFTEFDETVKQLNQAVVRCAGLSDDLQYMVANYVYQRNKGYEERIIAVHRDLWVDLMPDNIENVYQKQAQLVRVANQKFPDWRP